MCDHRHVCVRCICLGVYIHVCTHVEVEVNFGCLLQLLATLLFGQLSLNLALLIQLD